MTRTIGRGAALFALCVSALGCGDSGGGGGEATDSVVPEVGETKAALVTASGGGELTLDDFELRVPAGALRDDTELTLEVQSAQDRPEASSLRGPVYELGPDGTQFEMPVDIELPIERLPKSNETAEVVWFDEEAGEWVSVPGSSVREGRVVGRVDHFTAFSVRFVVNEDGDVVQAGGMCGGAFNACGGDPEGDWAFEAACVSLPAGEGPGGPECSGASFEASIDIDGVVSLSGGTVTGEQTVTISSTVTIPLDCLGGATCADAGFDTSGGDCVMTEMPETTTDTIEDTYVVSGNTIQFGQEEGPLEFCVEGNTLTIAFLEPDGGTEIRYTARRQ